MLTLTEASLLYDALGTHVVHSCDGSLNRFLFFEIFLSFNLIVAR